MTCIYEILRNVINISKDISSASRLNSEELRRKKAWIPESDYWKKEKFLSQWNKACNLATKQASTNGIFEDFRETLYTLRQVPEEKKENFLEHLTFTIGSFFIYYIYIYTYI